MPEAMAQAVRHPRWCWAKLHWEVQWLTWNPKNRVWRLFFLEQIAILVDSRVVLRGGMKDRESMTLRTNLCVLFSPHENPGATFATKSSPPKIWKCRTRKTAKPALQPAPICRTVTEHKTQNTYDTHAVKSSRTYRQGQCSIPCQRIWQNVFAE